MSKTIKNNNKDNSFPRIPRSNIAWGMQATGKSGGPHADKRDKRGRRANEWKKDMGNQT
jgi:hypothetical protein